MWVKGMDNDIPNPPYMAAFKFALSGWCIHSKNEIKNRQKAPEQMMTK